MKRRFSADMRPRRGDIWEVNFNSPPTAPTPKKRVPASKLPTTGAEIFKTRPALVVGIEAKWRLNLQIVVPITGWRDSFRAKGLFWMVKLNPDETNGLAKVSAADTFQVKSVAHERFGSKLGTVARSQLELIVKTIAFNLGYSYSPP